MTLKERLQSLINAANTTTGKSDADMTTATQSLIDGFGGGGGGGTLSIRQKESVPIKVRGFVLSENVKALNVTINDSAAVTSDLLGYITSANKDGLVATVEVLGGGTVNGGDIFRQFCGVKELHLVGFKPIHLWRFLYQMDKENDYGGYQGENGLTVTGISLQYITELDSAFAGYRPTGAEIYWEDELMNDAIFSNFNICSETSFKRLVAQLHDYSAGLAHTLTLGVHINALTPEEIQSANAKGWTIA